MTHSSRNHRMEPQLHARMAAAQQLEEDLEALRAQILMAAV